MNTFDIPDHQLDVIFHYGAYPLWTYLQEVVGVNIVDVCPRVTKEVPVLKTTNGDLVVRMVDLPHTNELGSIYSNDINFLVNAINVVFESLKEGVERDGVKLMEPFKFSMDANYNLYLVGIESGIRITDKALAVVSSE
jgi:hypothetical protein